MSGYFGESQDNAPCLGQFAGLRIVKEQGRIWFLDMNCDFLKLSSKL